MVHPPNVNPNKTSLNVFPSLIHLSYRKRATKTFNLFRNIVNYRVEKQYPA